MDFTAFCKQFSDFVPEATQDGERYYLIGEELAAFRTGEQRKPYAKGLYLGMGKEFVPTPALLTILAPHSKRKAIITTERAEWLFLCGRDVFSEGFRTEQKDGLVLVQNERDENIGLGKIVTNSNGEPLLKNLLDRGNYLRHEKVSLGASQPKKYSTQKKYGRRPYGRRAR